VSFINLLYVLTLTHSSALAQSWMNAGAAIRHAQELGLHVKTIFLPSRFKLNPTSAVWSAFPINTF
jgi:hypothetical protein